MLKMELYPRCQRVLIIGLLIRKRRIIAVTRLPRQKPRSNPLNLRKSRKKLSKLKKRSKMQSPLLMVTRPRKKELKKTVDQLSLKVENQT